jgi:hypothetical protein
MQLSIIKPVKCKKKLMKSIIFIRFLRYVLKLI